MYRTLLGWPTFRKAMDLYFKRHDGQAVTCDDFRRAMADASGRDLTQFERWYLQVRLHLGWRDCISGWRLGWRDCSEIASPGGVSDGLPDCVLDCIRDCIPDDAPDCHL
jgi:hypothetical protein